MSVKFSPRSAGARGTTLHHSGLQHDCDLAERIGKLLLNPDFSDLELVVEGEAHGVHRAILVSSSEYFRTLLRDDTKEAPDRTVVLEDVPLRGFKALLKYIYTGQLDSETMDVETIIEVIEVANLFGLEKFLVSLSRSMQQSLSTESFCQIYIKTQILQLPHLDEAFNRKMDEHPNAVLGSEFFCRFPATVLCKMLSRDTFCADETEIFKAVQRWCAEQPNDEDIPEVLKTIRLPLIATRDLVKTVKNSGLITADQLLEIIEMKESRTLDLNYRVQLLLDENLATQDRGAKQLIPNACGDIMIPTSGGRFESRPLPSKPVVSANPGLIIALDKPYSVNYIELQTSQQTGLFRQRLSGYAETSVDLAEWIRVGEYKDDRCAAKIYFEPRVIRYVRIVQIVPDVKLTTLEVCYIRSPAESRLSSETHWELEFLGLEEESSLEYVPSRACELADSSNQSANIRK